MVSRLINYRNFNYSTIQQGVNQLLGNRVVKVALCSLFLLGALFAGRSYHRAISYTFKTDVIGKTTHQPEDKKIARLTKRLMDVQYPALQKALQKHANDPWNQREVLQAADVCLRASHTISQLTLKDLQPFVKKLSAQGIQRSPAVALCSKDSYQFQTFLLFSRMYHYVRGGAKLDPAKQELYFPYGKIPESHATAFYTQGTLQNHWNTLYNGFCEEISTYVSQSELMRVDSRYPLWTQKDTGVSTFRRVPI